ncbi:MAG: foldase protein PrsA, partial [Frankiaceae bacterium]|nr:foldase protein PrsA [Frankiaceae bacterium]
MPAKSSTPRRIAVGAVALAAVAVLSACGRGGLDRNTAAEVGADRVTRADVLGAVDRALAVTPNLPRRDLTQLQLTTLIRLKLYEQEAAKRGLTITADDVKAARATLDQAASGDLVRAAAAAGFAEADLGEVINQTAYNAVLVADALKSGPVTDAELEAFRAQHEADFADQAHVAHILFKESDEALAKQIYGQIKAGGDFAALAAKYSIDEQTKATAGDLGAAAKGSYVPEFEAAVWNAKPGD